MKRCDQKLVRPSPFQQTWAEAFGEVCTGCFAASGLGFISPGIDHGTTAPIGLPGSITTAILHRSTFSTAEMATNRPSVEDVVKGLMPWSEATILTQLTLLPDNT